jgi:hypothetical protein
MSSLRGASVTDPWVKWEIPHKQMVFAIANSLAIVFANAKRAQRRD